MLSRFCFFATNMQSELKSCAGTVIRDGPELAAVGFNNRTADRQPHAHASRFCREESLEKMIQTLGFQSNPGVLYRDEDFIRFISARADEQLSATVGYRCHRFDPVHHKVEYHLLQLHPIAKNTRKIRSQFHPQHHAIFLYFSLYQTNNLLNDFVDVQRGLLGATFLDQRANPGDHVASAISVPENVSQGDPCFFEIWGFAG